MGPSGGRLAPPFVVFQTRPHGAARTAAPMLCRTAFAPAQRHWTFRMPAVASAALVESATVVPPTTVPAAGVTTAPSGGVLSTTTVAVAVAVCNALSVATLQTS